MTESVVWHDPIVAEIHAVRERLASEFNNDLAAYSQATEAHCRALGFHPVGGERSRAGNDVQGVVAPEVQP